MIDWGKVIKERLHKEEVRERIGLECKRKSPNRIRVDIEEIDEQIKELQLRRSYLLSELIEKENNL